MANFNRTQFVGRLTAEPVPCVTKNAYHVLAFTLAVDNPISKKNKKAPKTAEFIPHEIYGKLADAMEKHLHKGMLVLTEGSLHISPYTKDGVSHKSLKIVARWIGFLAWPKGQKEEEVPDCVASFEDVESGEVEGDDLPF